MKPQLSSLFQFAWVSVLCLGLMACGSDSESRVLRFTAIPDANTTDLKQKFDQLAKYLAAELQVQVEYVPTISYEASVEAFKNGDVQLAWFGGLTGVQARNAVAGALAIAQGVVDPNYKSYFIAHKDSGLEPSEDFPQAIAERSFTFGAEDSTSGRLMPEYFIRQASGKSPEDFFGVKVNSFSGAHDATAKLVEAGSFEVGALSYKKYDSMVAEGKLDPEKCRIIWTTPPYPDYNWTSHPDLESQFRAGFTAEVQEALVNLEDPQLLGTMLRPEGLIKATNDDFQRIHDLALELGFLK